MKGAMKWKRQRLKDFMAKKSLKIQYIRMASEAEIIAMKIDVISRGGRKKDFWDIHELMDDYPVVEMLAFHERRYPFNHDRATILAGFTRFEIADGDFDPICFRAKHWELIKLDMLDLVKNHRY